MANALYAVTKGKWLNPGTLGTTSADAVDMIDDNIKLVLVDAAGYTVNTLTDEDLADIPAGSRDYTNGTSGNLTAKTVTATAGSPDVSTFDAADVTLSSVGLNGNTAAEALVIYKDTGTEATSSLIAYIDTATGLPVTPNGGDITIQWAAAGIFQI